MSGSVEAAKDAATNAVKETAKGADKNAGEAKPSPEELLKKAVSGAGDKPAAATAKRKSWPRLDAPTMAAATGALAFGIAFGMMTAPRERSGEALNRIESGLEAGRTEAARLNTEIERLTRTLAAIRESGEAARGEGKSLASGLTERLSRLEEGLDRKLAALAEKAEPAPRASPSGASVPVEKQAAMVPAATPIPASVTPAAKPEPTQTASIAEPKAIAEPKTKTETVESWALREVYDGVAMLEDRKRRLVEVAPGDSVPGLGRVESIERRGRTWVVVTKQGLITPQMW